MHIMKNEQKITTAANSKTMNAVEKEKLFAAAASAEDDPAKVDIEEFDTTGAGKKSMDNKNESPPKKNNSRSTNKK